MASFANPFQSHMSQSFRKFLIEDQDTQFDRPSDQQMSLFVGPYVLKMEHLPTIAISGSLNFENRTFQCDEMNHHVRYDH